MVFFYSIVSLYVHSGVLIRGVMCVVDLFVVQRTLNLPLEGTEMFIYLCAFFLL